MQYSCDLARFSGQVCELAHLSAVFCNGPPVFVLQVQRVASQQQLFQVRQAPQPVDLCPLSQLVVGDIEHLQLGQLLQASLQQAQPVLPVSVSQASSIVLKVPEKQSVALSLLALNL